MATGKSKYILGELADLWSRFVFAINMMTDQREPLFNGDTIEICDNSAFTVIADGATQTDAAAVTTNALSLVANLHPWINLEVGAVSEKQLLDGKWAPQTAAQAVIQLKNYMDEQLLRTYLAESLCWLTGSGSAAAAYHDNVAGDTLTNNDWLNCKAALLANDGVMPQNLMAFVSPFGEASLSTITAFIPAFQEAEKGNVGLPRLGFVHNVPVYSTNSVRRNKVIDTSAAVTTGSGVTHTYTVAEGHGFVPGMLVTVAGHDADENISTPTAITSTTATTIVVTTSATADGTSSDAVGTITDATSWNIMLDKASIHVAQQIMPRVREVPHDNSTGTALQVSSLWGRIGRAGRCRVLHSPGSAA